MSKRQEDFKEMSQSLDVQVISNPWTLYERGCEDGYQYAIEKVCDIMNHYCNRTGVHPSRRVDIIDHIRKEIEE